MTSDDLSMERAIARFRQDGLPDIRMRRPGADEDALIAAFTIGYRDAMRDALPIVRSLRNAPRAIPAPVSDTSKRSCWSCASCYMEPNGEPELICGHQDAGLFGTRATVASGPGGHCGSSLTKWKQHPLRNSDGSLKP